LPASEFSINEDCDANAEIISGLPKIQLLFNCSGQAK